MEYDGAHNQMLEPAFHRQDFSMRFNNQPHWEIPNNTASIQPIVFQLTKNIIFRETLLERIDCDIQTLDCCYWKYCLERIKSFSTIDNDDKYAMINILNQETMVLKRNAIYALQNTIAVGISHLRSVTIDILEQIVSLRILISKEIEISDDILSIFWKKSNYLLKMRSDIKQFFAYQSIRYWLGFIPNPLFLPPAVTPNTTSFQPYLRWKEHTSVLFKHFFILYKEQVASRQRNLHSRKGQHRRGNTTTIHLPSDQLALLAQQQQQQVKQMSFLEEQNLLYPSSTSTSTDDSRRRGRGGEEEWEQLRDYCALSWKEVILCDPWQWPVIHSQEEIVTVKPTPSLLSSAGTGNNANANATSSSTVEKHNKVNNNNKVNKKEEVEEEDSENENENDDDTATATTNTTNTTSNNNNKNNTNQQQQEEKEEDDGIEYIPIQTLLSFDTNHTTTNTPNATTTGSTTGSSFWQNGHHNPYVVEVAIGLEEVFPKVMLVPPLTSTLQHHCELLTAVIEEEYTFLIQQQQQQLQPSPSQPPMIKKEKNNNTTTTTTTKVYLKERQEKLQPYHTTTTTNTTTNTNNNNNNNNNNNTHNNNNDLFSFRLETTTSSIRWKLEQKVQQQRSSILLNNTSNTTANTNTNTNTANNTTAMTTLSHKPLKKLASDFREVNRLDQKWFHAHAISIQCRIRGFLGRKRARILRLKQKWRRAIIRLQSVCRGFIGRLVSQQKTQQLRIATFLARKQVMKQYRASLVITQAIRSVANKYRIARGEIPFRAKQLSQQQQTQQSQPSKASPNTKDVMLERSGTSWSLLSDDDNHNSNSNNSNSNSNNNNDTDHELFHNTNANKNNNNDKNVSSASSVGSLHSHHSQSSSYTASSSSVTSSSSSSCVDLLSRKEKRKLLHQQLKVNAMTDSIRSCRLIPIRTTTTADANNNNNSSSSSSTAMMKKNTKMVQFSQKQYAFLPPISTINTIPSSSVQSTFDVFLPPPFANPRRKQSQQLLKPVVSASSPSSQPEEGNQQSAANPFAVVPLLARKKEKQEYEQMKALLKSSFLQ